MMIKFLIFNQSINHDENAIRTHAGENPNGLAVHRINHSATSSSNLQNFYRYYYLKISLSLQKLNDYEIGSTKFCGLVTG